MDPVRPALCLCYYAFQVLGLPDGHIQHCPIRNLSGLEPVVNERPVYASLCILPPSCVSLPSILLFSLAVLLLFTCLLPKSVLPVPREPMLHAPIPLPLRPESRLTSLVPIVISPSLDRPSWGQTLALMEAL